MITLSKMSQNIVPATQTNVVVITSFSVQVISITLFSKAELRVDMFDESKIRVNSCVIEMKGEDYANWNNNDEYVYEFVANQLGYTLQ